MQQRVTSTKGHKLWQNLGSSLLNFRRLVKKSLAFSILFVYDNVNL